MTNDLMTISVFITLLASILLLEQWLHQRKNEKNDYSLFWLSLSFLVWVPFMVFYRWFGDFTSNKASLIAQLLSLSNNVFILLAYPHFQHARGDISLFNRRIKVPLEGEIWNTIIATVAGISLIATSVLLTFKGTSDNNLFVATSVPNTIFSFFAISMLWWALHRTFTFRKRYLLRILTTLTFSAFLIYQIYFIVPKLVFDLGITATTIAVISINIKISYIFLIYKFAESYSDEQRELFDHERVYIEILGPENPDSTKKDGFIFVMSLDQNFKNREVSLSYVETITLLNLANARQLSRENGYVKIMDMDQHRLLMALALNIIGQLKKRPLSELRREISNRRNNRDFNHGLRQEALNLAAKLNALLLAKKRGKRRLRIRRVTNLVYSNKEIFFYLKKISDQISGEKARLKPILQDLKIILEISEQNDYRN